MVRWLTPIDVNTNGIARAELALQRFEQRTGGLITFRRVTTNPTNGLVFVEGNSVDGSGRASCANVTDTPPPNPGLQFNFEQRLTGSNRSVMAGMYAIHLGSGDCDDQTKGDHETAIAEHALAQALGGIRNSFMFNADKGIADPLMFAVLVTIYANAPGTAMAQIRVLGQ